MLRARLFGPRASETIEDWRVPVDELGDDELLWVDVTDTDDDELSELAEHLQLPAELTLRSAAERGPARLVNAGSLLQLTVHAVCGSRRRPV